MTLGHRIARYVLLDRRLLAAAPIINEFMASNSDTLADGDGQSSDWIEIFNAGDAAVDLADWHLTDDAANLTRWTFPASLPDVTLLDPGELLVVFASGTLVGGQFSTDVPAQLGNGKSLSLDGVDDYVELSPHVGAFSSLSAGTIAAWIKTDGGGTHVVFGASDQGDGSSELRLFVEGNVLKYDIREDNSPDGQLTSPSAVNDTIWHHVAAVVDGASNAALYLDGNAVAGDTEPFFSAVTALDQMAIGRNVDSSGPQWMFDGLIDDLAVWGETLDAEKIAALANGASPADVSGIGQSIATDVAAEMHNGKPSSYLRIPFAVGDTSSFDRLRFLRWLACAAEARTFSGSNSTGCPTSPRRSVSASTYATPYSPGRNSGRGGGSPGGGVWNGSTGEPGAGRPSSGGPIGGRWGASPRASGRSLGLLVESQHDVQDLLGEVAVDGVRIEQTFAVVLFLKALEQRLERLCLTAIGAARALHARHTTHTWLSPHPPHTWRTLGREICCIQAMFLEDTADRLLHGPRAGPGAG